jgi:hypothetical protein
MELSSRLLGAGLQQVLEDVSPPLAATGTSLSGALPTQNGFVYVATTPSGSGILLYATARPGDSQVVYNAGANTLAVYPPLGEALFGASNGVPFSLPSGAKLKFQKYLKSTWIYTDLSTWSSPLQSGFSNLGLKASIAANALTIALKGKDGNDPSATNPVRIAFRNATLTAGDSAVLSVTAPLSLVISSGSTLGVASISGSFRIWVAAFNDGGTVRLGAINCVPTNGSSIYPLGQLPIASSTAEGGAGGATSVQTFYTGAAVGSKPYTVLGYLTWENGLVTAGTWNSLPSHLQLFGPGVLLPGGLVQSVRGFDGTVATGTGIIPSIDANPTVGQGDAWATISFTPTSGANVAAGEAQGNFSTSAPAGTVLTTTLFDNLGGAVKAVSAVTSQAVGSLCVLRMSLLQLFGVTSTLTISARVGGSVAGTTTRNGVAGGRLYGGTLISYLEIRELMG